MKPTLSDLHQMAFQAGEILLEGFSTRPGSTRYLEVEYKGEIDPVTVYDKRSEEFLLGEIRSRFPEGRIITEESGELRGDDCCQWFIDPLDGTINYLHGLPLFAVSVAVF